MADDENGSGSPWRALIGLAVIVVVGLGMLFVMQQLRHAAAIQDCLASGRQNCAPIGSTGG
jgi:hypothetical protein